MRIRKGLAVGMSVVMLSVGGASAFAEKQRVKEKPKEADALQNLGLSTDQQKKVEALTNERKAAITASQQKIVVVRQKLVTMLFDKKASDREIDQVADQLASADREALVAQVKFHKAMRQILTQDQLTTLSKNQK